VSSALVTVQLGRPHLVRALPRRRRGHGGTRRRGRPGEAARPYAAWRGGVRLARATVAAPARGAARPARRDGGVPDPRGRGALARHAHRVARTRAARDGRRARGGRERGGARGSAGAAPARARAAQADRGRPALGSSQRGHRHGGRGACLCRGLPAPDTAGG
jgi:hypothetical protein